LLYSVFLEVTRPDSHKSFNLNIFDSAKFRRSFQFVDSGNYLNTDKYTHFIEIMNFMIIYFFFSLHVVDIFGKKISNLSNKVCEFSDIKYRRDVNCHRVDNMKDVQDFFDKNLNFTQVSLLTVETCSSKFLSNSIFWNTTIRAIRLQCPFDKMENDALSSIQALTHLDLRETEFEKIPIAVSKLDMLKTVHLTDGELTRIDLELQNMTNLLELKLSGNRISGISREAFSGLSNLKMIDLSQNKLILLHPGTFDGCKELTKIFLKKNSIISVDRLFNNPNLQEVNLQDNNIKSIDNAFQQNINLEILNLNSNPLMQISGSAFNANVKQLRILTLSKCRLSFLLPTVFQALTKLEKLVLSYNLIESLPVEIFDDLSRLLEIHLKRNQISYLGEVFRNNYRLRIIILTRNRLETVENLFHGLHRLENVDLAHNKLKVITEDDFSTTRSMRSLDLNKNSIARIDSNAFLMMANLKNLSLAYNKLKTLNGSLRNCHELETLKLHNNQLKEIRPSEMSNLKKLMRLNLNYNKLSNVHEAFKNLIHLQILDLNRNKLTTISRSTFPPRLNIKNITIGVNPWICDCRLLWLLKYPNLARKFKCSSPKYFFKKSVNKLTTQDLTQWSENCDKNSCECTCVLHENEFFVRVDCSSRSLTQVPTVLPAEVGELHLQNNLLRNPIDLSIHSLNRLRYLDMEQNFLTKIDFYLPKNLQILKLSGNNLTRFMSYFPPSILSWTLSDNPWICDSETLQFWKFLTSERKKVWDVNSIMCSRDEGKTDLFGKIICDLSEEDFRPEKSKLYIFLAVGLSVLALTAIGCHLVYTQYHYHIKVWLYSRGFSCLKKRDSRDSRKKHDAYLCFSVKDSEFVQEHILPELEDKEPFYSLFVPPRDLRVGKFELDQQLEEVRNSKRIIIIVSQNFIDNEVCMEIFRIAFLSGLEEKHYRIIPIIAGTLPPMSDLDPSLKVALQSNRSLRFGQKLLWEMVRFAMPEKSQPTDALGSEDDIDMPLLNAW
ncbi:unnamed protein product, partial [Larinioides sclopetarius]